jgi:hypothetical protein
MFKVSIGRKIWYSHLPSFRSFQPVWRTSGLHFDDVDRDLHVSRNILSMGPSQEQNGSVYRAGSHVDIYGKPTHHHRPIALIAQQVSSVVVGWVLHGSKDPHERYYTPTPYCTSLRSNTVITFSLVVTGCYLGHEYMNERIAT